MNLTTENIHLWFIPLGMEVNLDKLFFLLSTDELQKANQYKFINLKLAYVLRRSALRRILSLYCKVDPRFIKFNYTKFQKPFIEDNFLNLEFNLSNSHQMAILAVSKQSLIGVDLEYVKPIDNIIDIAKNYFSKIEFKKFAHILPEQRLRAFYVIWTRKEAFVKAIGEGLSYPLSSFDVTFLMTEPIKVIKVGGSVMEANKWTLNGFDFNYLNCSYIVGLLTKGSPKSIIYFKYKHEENNQAFDLKISHGSVMM
jgi:4'-phosphopantetheinyl transferase